MAILTILLAAGGGAVASNIKPAAKALLFRYVQANKDQVLHRLNPRVGAWMSTLSSDNYRSEVFDVLYDVIPRLSRQPKWVQDAVFDIVEEMFLPSKGVSAMGKRGIVPVQVVQMLRDEPSQRIPYNPPELKNLRRLP